MRLPLLLIALAVTTPAHAQSADTEAEIDRLWTENGTRLQAGGIDRPAFRLYHYWSLGQYMIGMCAPHLPEGDVRRWRDWWRDKPLVRAPGGPELLEGGTLAYDAGVADRKRNAMSRDQCLPAVTSWAREFETVVAMAVETP